MLKFLPILTCLTIISAPNIIQSGSQVIIEDCELQVQEHLNLEGLEITEKENVKYVDIQNCSGVIGDKTFTEFPKFAHLKIWNSNIEDINTTLSIRALFVLHSYFPNLDEHLQQKLPELETLVLDGNKDFQVDPHKLKSLKKLTVLFINETRFTEACITNEWFKGLDLQKLYLRDCNIRCISEDAFNSLKNLGELDLLNNHISNFDNTTFKNLTELKILHINGNDIETIDLNNFASQKDSLENLYISWNMLKQSKISAEELLKAFPKLKFLYISINESNNPKAVEFCKRMEQNGTYCYANIFSWLSKGRKV